MAEGYAARVTNLAEIDGDGKPHLDQWDEWRELAADIRDAVHQQTVMLVASRTPKGKPRPGFKPVPRPESAMQRALKAREKELEALLEDDFMGLLGG